VIMGKIFQIVNTKHLVEAIDDSVDTYMDWTHKDFQEFLAERYDETKPSFRSSVVRNGVKVPIEVGVSRHKKPKFFMGNGHHRLSVAYFKKVPDIPVMFRTVQGLAHFADFCVDPDTYDNKYVDAEGFRFDVDKAWR
jgi:hypothetical protein